MNKKLVMLFLSLIFSAALNSIVAMNPVVTIDGGCAGAVAEEILARNMRGRDPGKPYTQGNTSFLRVAYSVEDLFLMAARCGDIDFVRQYITNAGDVAYTNQYERTALHYATRYGCFDVISEIRQFFCDTLSQEREVTFKDIQFFRSLLMKQDIKGMTVLHVAVQFGFVNLVRYFLECFGQDQEARQNFANLKTNDSHDSQLTALEIGLRGKQGREIYEVYREFFPTLSQSFFDYVWNRINGCFR